MPIRKLNFTGRKRILRQDARIRIHEERDEIWFEAALSLGRYGLDAQARVFVEAQRQTQYRRFDFGTVGNLQPPADCSLKPFGSPEALLFRVKVVSPDHPRGLILAQADKIRPRRVVDDGDRISLLPVVPDENLGEEIWQLEFGDDTRLKLNSAVGDWRALARDPAFEALVYPSILRTVLVRICLQEEYGDADDPDDWRSRWLRFAISLGGTAPPKDEDGQESWIDDVVRAFCRKFRTTTNFRKYL